ncbi:SgcJ/EcaC family oxidoreductase [Rubrivirga sp.]|uniref:SgcJ/EcaC family oxidoreductase n=1 Tax=Rubrivirga sp. TaxID=1885344 RepID=UPI003C7629F0
MTTPDPDPGYEADVRATIDRVVRGWNTKDADLFASAFTEPHDYVAVGGRLSLDQTAAQNVAVHERIWSTIYAEGSTIAFDVVSVDRVAPGVALAVVSNRDDYVRGGERQVSESVITAVLVRTDEGWRIRQFNNNAVRRDG